MTLRAYRTALVGFGKMAQGYSHDAKMALYYPYASHAQVLRDHPYFDWCAVVDPDEGARNSAVRDWGISNAAPSPEAVAGREKIEVAVLATPPDQRLAVLDSFPALKAVLVEKPLGFDLKSARDFVDAFCERNIMVQVNLWRRADQLLSHLATGELQNRIGRAQAVSFVYGNGLRNNGTHMVDLARMLFGEIVRVQRIGLSEGHAGSPIPGDVNPTFAAVTESGLNLLFQPLFFSHYRENGLTVWGETGRLEIMNEGLVIHVYGMTNNRAMQGAAEIAHDRPERLETSVGRALYRLYDNLAAALEAVDAERLCSPSLSALQTTVIVEAVAAAPVDGRWVDLP